jgi:hypothetical protein
LLACGPTGKSGDGQTAWALDALISYQGKTTHLILDVADGTGGSGNYKLDEPITYSIYIRDDAGEAEIANLEQKLKVIPSVVDVHFLSKDAVEAEQSKADPNYAAERAVLGYNALPARLDIKVTSPNTLAMVKQLTTASGLMDPTGILDRSQSSTALTDSRGAAELRIDPAGLNNKSQEGAPLFAQLGTLNLSNDLRAGVFNVTVTTDGEGNISSNSLQGSFSC